MAYGQINIKLHVLFPCTLNNLTAPLKKRPVFLVILEVYTVKGDNVARVAASGRIQPISHLMRKVFHFILTEI